jgi:DNA-directed RNA polymerase specialized sigma24 family protein
MRTDGELLRGYADGHSQTAFAELVERHVGLVFHAALRRTNQDTPMAEEVTQVVFTALAREAGKLGRHTALTGW